MISGNSSASGRCPASSRPARISARICGLPCITVVLLRSSAWRTQDRVQAGDHGGGAVRELLRVIHEHDGVLAGLAGVRRIRWSGARPKPGRPARNGIGFSMRTPFSSVPFLLPRSSTVHWPSRPDQRQVLARKSDIVGVAQLIRAGAAERDAVAIQGHGGGFAVQVADDQFAGGKFWALAVKVLAYHSFRGLSRAFDDGSASRSGAEPADRLEERLYLTARRNMMQNVCFSPARNLM